MDDGQNAMRALINEAHRTHMNSDDVLWSSGYRLDPYPNGKSKGELIKRIESVETERDKTRNLLRTEHDKAICNNKMALLPSYRSIHEENEPNCPVCAFLSETSTVKR